MAFADSGSTHTTTASFDPVSESSNETSSIPNSTYVTTNQIENTPPQNQPTNLTISTSYIPMPETVLTTQATKPDSQTHRNEQGFSQQQVGSPPSYSDLRTEQHVQVIGYTVNQTVNVRHPEPNPLYGLLPTLHISVAIICCVINIILPGIGSIVAAFAALTCCARADSASSRAAVLCVNFWCGILQLTLSVILVGWVWSIAWGFIFIGMSTEFKAPPISVNVQETIQPVMAPATAEFHLQDPPPAYHTTMSTFPQQQQQHLHQVSKTTRQILTLERITQKCRILIRIRNVQSYFQF
ncbi:protein SPEC3-like [Ptychodera flava]|uniref:protein SPEC3-like n=1 Tax=Ptychodera flava TaxID=63121 RepID=UPI00396A74A9